MKYYPLQKKYFDDYQKKSRFKLFFSKSNILRTTIRKDPAKDPEYVQKNIKFIVIIIIIALFIVQINI